MIKTFWRHPALRILHVISLTKKSMFAILRWKEKYKSMFCHFEMKGKVYHWFLQLFDYFKRNWTHLGMSKISLYLLYLNMVMHKTTNLRTFLLNWPSKLRGKNGRNTTVVTQIRTSKYNYEVSKSWKIHENDSRNSTLLQGEPFLTMFYTINSSPLLVTPKSLYANNYFE